jgi:L-seryl-tRNA(Ser) seleniumtransferase
VKREYGKVPALRMMSLSKEEIGARAESIASQVQSREVKIEVIDGESVIGGGAAPSSVLPTRLLAITCIGVSADELLARLRKSDPPVIGRVEEGRVLLDLRTVFPAQDPLIANALLHVASPRN